MQPLSQALEDLAGQVKDLEDSAQANRAQLEQRQKEIADSVIAGAYEVGASVDEAVTSGRTRWSETKVSMRKPFEDLRSRHDKRRSERELHRALRQADVAEEDAANAIEIATYALNVAEYAVIDAILARMAADDLAGEPTGTSEGLAPLGATS